VVEVVVNALLTRRGSEKQAPTVASLLLLLEKSNREQHQQCKSVRLLHSEALLQIS
jgi:hypothetical protein